MLSELSNKTSLLILMVILLAFIVLLTVLGIVFIVALRKRAPVVKVVMAPPRDEPDEEAEPEEEEESPAAEEPAPEPTPEPAPEPDKEEVVAAEEPAPEPKPAPAPEPEEDVQDVDDEEEAVFVTEGSDRVRYDRSFTAKLIQLPDETKDRYTQLKNELMSYKKIASRMSWKRETFRLGRMSVARFIIRGKTLCLLLAIEPAGLEGTKYSVEDVSKVSSNVDTPSMFRIKSNRKLKQAKELIRLLMAELKVEMDSSYEPQDYYMAYVGDLGLMQRGLIKRIVSSSTRTFRVQENKKEMIIEEVETPTEPAPETEAAQEAAATENADAPAPEAETTETAEEPAPEAETEAAEEPAPETVEAEEAAEPESETTEASEPEAETEAAEEPAPETTEAEEAAEPESETDEEPAAEEGANNVEEE